LFVVVVRKKQHQNKHPKTVGLGLPRPGPLSRDPVLCFNGTNGTARDPYAGAYEHGAANAVGWRNGGKSHCV
jgi:hypothetical protein